MCVLRYQDRNVSSGLPTFVGREHHFGIAGKVSLRGPCFFLGPKNRYLNARPCQKTVF